MIIEVIGALSFKRAKQLPRLRIRQPPPYKIERWIGCWDSLQILIYQL
jgi:hypothetical protein